MNTRATSATFSRLCLAFVLTPLLPPFYGALFFAQPWALPIGLIVTYPSALVFGLPSFLLWVRRFRQWWVFAVWGAACSLPALITYAVRQDVLHLESFSLTNGAIVLGWGAFAGLCFWLLGIAGDSPLRWRDVLDMGPPST
jgi:hypothetical protein